MDEPTDSAEKILDLSASNVEACRICLATDIKLHSLQDTHLGTCIESIGGFTKSFDGLPNYVCYECAPILKKCNKLIEKSKRAESTLQEIFVKNGMISKPLIEEQIKSDPTLQSPLLCYFLNDYYYINYEDNSSSSNFTKIESNPNGDNRITLKNEPKEEPEEEVSDTVLLQNIIKVLCQEGETNQNVDQEDGTINNVGQENETINNVVQENETINNVGQEDGTINSVGQQDEAIMDSKDEETNSDSDVEAIEVDVPVVEIVSDDDNMGEDFISLKSYTVKHHIPVNGSSVLHDVPRYNKPKMRPLGVQKEKKGKKKKKKNTQQLDRPRSFQDEDKFVRRYFNIKRLNKPGRAARKRYFCMSCPETYDYVDDARDHTILGCQIPSSKNDNPSSSSGKTALWEICTEGTQEEC
ncbi:hypothetical protein PYW07_004976 [Mythimna separata]|uniref:ZAD domain-containing protein n=1 Tax=Mythimna separata TaxID=271217 RepID=A0AAD8DPH9_MYTSE|nr:hypothetical protein PYW07_004976 [Mythimna separata]